jgi:cell division protein FtsZ
MEFNLPKGKPSIIKVIGVGGGGSNAVNHMFSQGIKGVDFLICNTDQQALDISPVGEKLQLGGTLTEGMGAGSIPDVGRNAAIESADDIQKIFNPETKMVFITAGMGGGTGTGAAPIIAQTAREMGILTVGIVTLPFIFEGRKRKQQAEKGIEELRSAVDTLLIINNDKLRQMYGNLKMSEVFEQADNVLTIAAKGIAEIITRTGHINVDFQDVSTVMKSSGVAIMGAAVAQGENRAIKAVENALSSPLLNDNDIKGARFILLNMEFGSEEITMDEIADITDYIQEEAGSTADIIWGYGQNEEMSEGLSVTLIATGFDLADSNISAVLPDSNRKKVHTLDDPQPTAMVKPVQQKAPEVPVAPVTTEPFIKNDDSQGKIEFKLDMPADEVQEVKPEPLEPFIKPVSQIPPTPPAPQMQEPKPFIPRPISQTPPAPKPIVHSLDAENSVSEPVQPEVIQSEPVSEKQENEEGQQTRVKNRMGRLKELSRRLRTASGLSELEDVPAYQRRAVSLEDVPHSSESQVSRYSLDGTETEDGKKTGISNNNSFLHDNVD